MNDASADKDLNSIRRSAGRLTRSTFALSDCGHAFVEFALMLPIFTTLLLGATEFARLAYAAIEVTNAAHAGVLYGAQNHTTAMNTNGMQTAATNDGPNISSITALATTFCNCSDGTSITCANASSTCTARIIKYVKVTTTAVVNPILHFPGLPTTYTLTSTAEMRVEQ